MRVPACTKTWQLAVNQSVPYYPDGPIDPITLDPIYYSDQRTSAEMFIVLKSILTSFPLNPWFVVGSCDRTAFGLPGPDLLTSFDKFFPVPCDMVGPPLAPGDPRSWIVMQQPGSGMQLCFAFGVDGEDLYTQPYTSEVAISLSGSFAGGNLGARPTAPDEFLLATPPSHTTWCGFTYGDPLVLNVWHSSDGENTAVISFEQGSIGSSPNIWLVGVADDIPSGWTTPQYARIADTLFSGIYGTVAAGRGLKATFPSVGVNTLMGTLQGYMAASDEYYTRNNKNDVLLGQPIMQPMGVGRFAFRGPIPGYFGRIPDFWTVNSTVATGTVITHGSQKFATFVRWAFPWDDSIPVV